jgi:hypothetical protein
VSLFKTCAAILSQILLLQTGCDLWCHHAEPPLLASAVTAAGECHGTPVQRDDSGSKPARHDRSGLDCDPLKIAGNPEPQTIVKEPTQVNSRDILSMQLRIQSHPLLSATLNKELSNGSPPSSVILLI